jgi:GntR family transcriptional regulator
MTIQVDPSRATPPSRQLVEAILDRIAGGALEAGDRLPSVRGLAADALVNPNTVGKAYRELEALGVVAGRNGAGVFVTPAGPAKARRERRAATLAAVEAALVSALEAGHDLGVLRALLDRHDGAEEQQPERRRAS